MDLDRLRLSKVVGDRWTPDDANAIPIVSNRFQGVFTRGHDARGRHLPPAPQASAIVRWTGATYQLVKSYGVASVARVAAGQVAVTLDHPLDGNWIATADITGMKNLSASIDYRPAKTATACRLVLGETTYVGEDVWRTAPADASFVFHAWGWRTSIVEATDPPSLVSHRHIVDDVLDVELINQLAARGNRLVDAVEAEHRIAGPHWGTHQILGMPLGARLYEERLQEHLEGGASTDPVWSAGVWNPDTKWQMSDPMGIAGNRSSWLSVRTPSGHVVPVVRAYAEASATTMHGRPSVRRMGGGRYDVFFPYNAADLRVLIVTHGVRQ